MIVGKPINLEQLHAELASAGVALSGALGLTGNDLHTYNAQGQMVDLPASAHPVVAAHLATALTPAQQADRNRRQRLRAFVDQADVEWGALTAVQRDNTLRQISRDLILYLARNLAD